MLGLVILTVAFLIGVQLVAPLFEFARNESAVMSSSKAVSTINNVEKVWYVYPIIGIIFLIIWAFMKASQEEPYNYVR